MFYLLITSCVSGMSKLVYILVAFVVFKDISVSTVFYTYITFYVKYQQ
jgi:hypothetical protein